MKRKPGSLFFVLVIAFVMIFMMKSTAYASNYPGLQVTQEYILANVGDPITLSCYLKNDDGGKYTYVWYRWGSDNGKEKVGTGNLLYRRWSSYRYITDRYHL